MTLSVLLEQARAIAPDSEFVLNTYVYWLRTVGRCPEAIELARHALETDSNGTRTWTGIYNELSICKVLAGDAEEALILQAEADRLNPLSSSKMFRYGQMGWASLMLGRDQNAIMYLERSLAISREPAAAYTPWRYRLLAAAYARTGQLEEARHYLSEADQLWPYDTVRGGPLFLLSPIYVEQFQRYRDDLRLTGERDHVDEDVDFGVPADGVLHSEVGGRTPKEARGVRTIRTTDLVQFLATARPLVVDTVLYSWSRSIPGAVGLQFAGLGGSFTDEAQDRLRSKMQKLIGGDLRRPIVTIGWNASQAQRKIASIEVLRQGETLPPPPPDGRLRQRRRLGLFVILARLHQRLLVPRWPGGVGGKWAAGDHPRRSAVVGYMPRHQGPPPPMTAGSTPNGTVPVNGSERRSPKARRTSW